MHAGLLPLYIFVSVRPVPSWLVSSIGRALHQYRRGQGSNPVQAGIFYLFIYFVFSGFLSAIIKVKSMTAMISFHIILHPAVLKDNFLIFITSMYNKCIIDVTLDSMACFGL